jgi:Lhr-like helicase
MDAIKLHDQIVTRYKDYIGSFIDIRDADIADKVDEELKSGKLWPDPLIQFNPAYEQATSIDALVKEGVLHEQLAKVFAGYRLYSHQETALRLGATRKSFVVTSGTGSGKSLTYIGTIFNALFSAGHGAGTKALIVYPMNALINSQVEELKKFAKNYQSTTGKAFPIRFAAYTGQTGDEERAEIVKNPPDILLTNYMMLELLMTRHGEANLRDSIFQSLEFLAFDELHTYRGRQGADVSYLIRRIRAAASKLLMAMGTSATMSSKGSHEEQKTAVSEVATKIFGESIPPDRIVSERLERSLHWQGKPPAQAELLEAIQSPIDASAPLEKLALHPTAVWLENQVALEEASHGLKRRLPVTIKEASKKLAADAGSPDDEALAHLISLLAWIAEVNQRQLKAGHRYTCLPFKLHQFFAQTGSVYASLGTPGKRKVTLEPGLYEPGSDDRFVFPHVFSRASGWSFICVHVDSKHGRFLPREFNDQQERDGADFGYLIPEYSSAPGDLVWEETDESLGQLPTSWVAQTQSGLKFTAKFHGRKPSRVFYDEKGNFSATESPKFPFRAWFMSAAQNGLLFDPTAGLFFDPQTNERTKLTTLGNEGRSTSTTVTSFLILEGLEQAGYHRRDQKLLSFTDNRQDAALQSGHFNDFIRVVRIRSAIYHALKDGGSIMTSKDLGRKVREAMKLDLGVYSDNPNPSSSQREKIDEALDIFLTYQAIHDLRRGWRVVLPNLEKCALVEIDYEDREKEAEDEIWKSVPIFNAIDNKKRAELLRDVLDFFRLEYAVTSKNWLNTNQITENLQQIRSKLRPEWTIDSDESIKPKALRTCQLHKGYRGDTRSLGIQSSLGKYLKHYAQQEKLGLDLGRDGYATLQAELLKALEGCGFIEGESVRDAENQPTHVYRLVLETIFWKLGDGQTVRRDNVKQRAYGDFETKPNHFFRDLYRTDFGSLKNLTGADHTGQLNNGDRLDREERFRAEWTLINGGKEEPDMRQINARSISALFCSPTMELGIDISNLSVVHLRNAPPNAANYAQRGGRAGRSGQAALVFTYCSSYSPHDRHYFAHREQLVAGSVEAPRLDITNRELIRSHLHAAFMTRVGLPGVRQSILDLVDVVSPALPLKDEIKEGLNLSDAEITAVAKYFEAALVDRDHNPGLAWCTTDWIKKQLTQLEKTIDGCLDRWRALYREAKSSLTKATTLLESGLYKTTSDEHKRAKREVFQAQRQLDLLRNDIQKGSSQSEFYVFRYLAAEGFLPGYNFTRLPVRAFLTDGYERGEYISRPRLIGLREFGPQNIIYYNGSKYSVSQAVVPNVPETFTEARVCTVSGYWLDQDQQHLETCPITGSDLSQTKNKLELKPLMPLCEMLARSKEHITCEEEERLRQGFEIQTYFSLDGGDASRMRSALVLDQQEGLLKMAYLPAARLIQIAIKDRKQTDKGFSIGLESGRWNPRNDGPTQEEVKRVMIFTETTADALYLQPVQALGLDSIGVLSLQYALKRAIELRFQIEPAELGVYSMGNPDAPNILFYEASEGSLGVLSALVDDPQAFREVIDVAIKVCDFQNKGKGKASYDDLLSYYNQPHHLTVDRFSIEAALSKLQGCSMDCSHSSQDEDYEAQFQRLMKEKDPNSSTEETFLKYLHKHRLQLPDSAQLSVDGIYTKPDFFYKPDVWVFCDGTPHDEPAVQVDDAAKRKAIKAKGHEVIVFYYKDNLDDLVARYPDVFKKVK